MGLLRLGYDSKTALLLATWRRALFGATERWVVAPKDVRSNLPKRAGGRGVLLHSSYNGQLGFERLVVRPLAVCFERTATRTMLLSSSLVSHHKSGPALCPGHRVVTSLYVDESRRQATLWSGCMCSALDLRRNNDLPFALRWAHSRTSSEMSSD